MRTIWKFPIAIGLTDTIVEAPADAPVRLAGLDPATGKPAIWVELDPSASRARRQFAIEPTGGAIEDCQTHVGSIIDGGFVWHIFERARG